MLSHWPEALGAAGGSGPGGAAMSNDHTSWWFDSGTITPDDIMRAQQEAIDAGENPTVLDRKLKEAIEEAGGTIDDLARLWTLRNERDARWAAFREQLNRFEEIASRRKSQQTAVPKVDTARKSQQKPVPKVDTATMLRELIRQHPEIAREVLADEEGEAAP
ncbi:hypothetical protein [Nonomuraea angiospora]